MAETKVRMSHEVDLGPGVVLTPGYEMPERPAPGPGMGDRRIIVHTDNEARMQELTKFLTAEVADTEIASTYSGPVAKQVEKAEAAGDEARDARAHARQSAAANKA